MSHKPILFSLLIAVGFTALIGFAAFDDPIDKITRQLNKWSADRPVEKVYIHFDKPYYAAGDDIWFKAYVTSGTDHKLTTVSSVVNVDLLDINGVIKQSVKLQLTGGVAAGDFALPDTLNGGNYRIRAYTNYMRNAGSEYFFDQPINIINNILSNRGSNGSVATNTVGVANRAGSTDVQFFPESGNLVAGIPTRVAFKAVGADGLGENIQGAITDNNGKQVAQLAGSHLGMGVFELTPVSGTIYTARLTTASGQTRNVALPRVADKGYVLNVDNSAAESLQIKISANKVLLNQPAGVVLVAQSNGKICYSEKLKPGVVNIDKNKLPAGVVQLTLFSADGTPLNERLVFVHHPEKLRLTVTPDKQSYAARERVKISVTADSGKPAAGSFSVAVIDETKVPFNNDDSNSIMASLLLAADIKGNIEQPAYYFNDINTQTRADLDVLMMTQGYRRFEWTEILNDRLTPLVYQPETALQVTGTVSTTSGKPVVNGKVKLFNLDDINFILDTVTDARGRFAFTNLKFADSLRFIIQARTDKNKKDVNVLIDSIPPPNGKSSYLISTRQQDLSVYAKSSKELYQAQMRYGVGNHVIPLREVIIREKRQALKYSANLNGPGNADQVILARDLQFLGCIRVGDCLQGRLVGVTFRNGVPYSTRSFNRPMQLIVDGVYVDPGYINSINFNDIQAIEVLRSGASSSIYGGRGGAGVILITTKRGDYAEPYDGPVTGRGIKAAYPKGYLKVRKFYSPRYDNSKENKQLADLRSTIFWKPDLVTDTDGKATFEFFNAGTRGTYRVIVEGIDSDGNISSQVLRYKVE